MPSARSHGSAENRMCIGWPGSAMTLQSRRKALRPWNGKFEGCPAPKGASDREELSVSLKRYPDTNPEFFRSYIANPELRWPQATAELRSAWTAEGGCPYTSTGGRSRPFLLLSMACSDIFC